MYKLLLVVALVSLGCGGGGSGGPGGMGGGATGSGGSSVDGGAGGLAASGGAGGGNDGGATGGHPGAGGGGIGTGGMAAGGGPGSGGQLVTGTGGGAIVVGTGGGVVVGTGGGVVVGAGGGVVVGTGGGPVAGTVTFEQLSFNDPAIVSGADGVLHMVFTDGPTPDSAFRYARCAGDCGVGSNWTLTTVDTGSPSKDHARLVIGTDGRLHALYETYELSTSQTVYSSCAANCTVASNWSKTYLTSLFLGSSAAYRGAPLVIDAQNRLSFIVSTLTVNDTLTLATCAGNCDTLASWTTGVFRTGGLRTAMVARGTTLHAVMFNDVDSLIYRTCAGNCTATASWQESPPLFIHDGTQPTAIAVTAQGGVRVAYNQGASASNQTPAIKAQDNRVLVWSCDANCLSPAGWSGLILGKENEGQYGLAMAEQDGVLGVVLTNSIDATLLACGSGCEQAESWVEVQVDSTADFSAEYDPYVYGGAGCSAQPPYFAAWYLDEGVIAVRPDGSAAIAFSSHMLRKCSALQSMSTYLPGFGRVTFLP